jgi:hypothetical protein
LRAAGAPTYAGLDAAFCARRATTLAFARPIAFYLSVFSATAPTSGEIATLCVALLVIMLIAPLR